MNSPYTSCHASISNRALTADLDGIRVDCVERRCDFSA